MDQTKNKINTKLDKFKNKVHDNEIHKGVDSLKDLIHKEMDPIKRSLHKRIDKIKEHLDKDINRKYFSKELKKDKKSLLAKLTRFEKVLSEEMNPEALGITKHKKKWKKIVRRAERKINSLKKKRLKDFSDTLKNSFTGNSVKATT